MIIPRQVYFIQHNATKRIYIGSSGKLEERIANHFYALRSGKHPVEDMQKDFNEYGENYTVQVLDEIHSLDESGKEYEWMEKFKSRERGTGYNYKDHTAQNNKKAKKHSCRRDLHKVVDGLTDEQCIYVFTLLKNLF